MITIIYAYMIYYIYIRIFWAGRCQVLPDELLSLCFEWTFQCHFNHVNKDILYCLCKRQQRFINETQLGKCDISRSIEFSINMDKKTRRYFDDKIDKTSESYLEICMYVVNFISSLMWFNSYKLITFEWNGK